VLYIYNTKIIEFIDFFEYSSKNDDNLFAFLMRLTLENLVNLSNRNKEFRSGDE